MNAETNEQPEVVDIELEVQKHHRTQLELCERLERLADGLPNNFDTQECLSLSWQIYPTVKAAHRFEEEKLFPLLTANGQDNADLDRSMERLKFEHWEDESYAEEISTFLRNLIEDPQSVNIGKVSYMLRGFFEGMRRHIAFEAEHLLPQLEARKSKA